MDYISFLHQILRKEISVFATINQQQIHHKLSQTGLHQFIRKEDFALYGETHSEHNPQFSFHGSASYSSFVTDLENTVKTKLLTAD